MANEFAESATPSATASASLDTSGDGPAAGLVDGIGPRLRGIRHRRGLTLAELADETGISISTLSRLESGRRRASLDLLLRLAEAHRASLDDLVGAPQLADPRIRPRTYYRGGRAFIPLTRNSPAVIAVKIVLPGHPPESPVEQRAHEGYDWVYVLSGRVRLAIGDRETVLEPGEAAEFDTRLPHGTASASLDPAEILNLLSRQGERVHLRDLGDADA